MYDCTRRSSNCRKGLLEAKVASVCTYRRGLGVKTVSVACAKLNSLGHSRHALLSELEDRQIRFLHQRFQLGSIPRRLRSHNVLIFIVPSNSQTERPFPLRYWLAIKQFRTDYRRNALLQRASAKKTGKYWQNKCRLMSLFGVGCVSQNTMAYSHNEPMVTLDQNFECYLILFLNETSDQGLIRVLVGFQRRLIHLNESV